MANSRLKCTGCKDYYPQNLDTWIRGPSGNFHNMPCLADTGRKKAKKTAIKRHKEEVKVAKKKHQNDKKEVRTRTKWYAMLQALVNQYVVHVRDKDEPCYTCGKTDRSVKYDAGHYLTRAAKPELRFELTNIHRQCSVECNVHGSGMRVEYNEHIKLQYGQAHFDWLNGPHKPLKYQFPHWSDIEKEIIRYRKLLRDNGLKPSSRG